MLLIENTVRYFFKEISNCLSSKFLKQNLLLIAAFGLPLGLVDYVVSELFEEAGLMFKLGFAVVTFLWNILLLTIIVFTIKRNKKHDMDLTSYLSTNLLDVYWQTFKSFLLIFAGFIVLIIPGIYLATRQQFVFLIAQDDEMVADPIKKSFELSEGNFWPLLLIISICVATYASVMALFDFPFIINIFLYPIFATVHTMALVFFLYGAYRAIKQIDADV